MSLVSACENGLRHPLESKASNANVMSVKLIAPDGSIISDAKYANAPGSAFSCRVASNQINLDASILPKAAGQKKQQFDFFFPMVSDRTGKVATTDYSTSTVLIFGTLANRAESLSGTKTGTCQSHLALSSSHLTGDIFCNGFESDLGRYNVEITGLDCYLE